MPRYRDAEYSLYPRKLSEKTIWYYYVYIDGIRQPGKSTGIGFTRKRDEAKTRREAEKWCEEHLSRGTIGRVGAPTLSEWIRIHRFWDWRGSTYVRSILARSTKEKPGITKGFVEKAGRITKDHILPAHGHKPIDQITAYDCEQLLFAWQAEGKSNKTVNNWKSVYSTILGEYETETRMRDPKSTYFNPWKLVKPLAVEKNRFGGLTVAEVSKVIETAQHENGKFASVYFLAMKLAFLTGLRIGEVCGLHTDDVKDVEIQNGEKTLRMSYLQVKYQYRPELKGRALVKDKDERRIPITPDLRDELDQFMTGKGRYIFSLHPRQETPITANRLRDWFYKQLEKSGINKEERTDRNITFHSTRRFFNTLLRRANIANDVIQRFTGHDSDEMTEHYTDYLPEDLAGIADAQRMMIEGEIRE